ncbi:MAG: DUF4292 domain-containing protein [Bacteroidaceae bacterium]|nr:DUF4292 domain-containing protein [Bacteroidaceae bacterium]
MRKTKGKKYTLLFIFAALILVGCRSTKKEPSVNVPGITLHQIQQMQALKPAAESFSAKVRISADISGKTLSSAGTLGVEQGKGIQLGVTVMGLFEVARFEINPSYIRLVNKAGKEYVSINYSEVDFFERTGLNYNILQSLFLNKPFLPDGGDFAQNLESMNMSMEHEKILTMATPEKKFMQYLFSFDVSSGNLVRTKVIYNDTVYVECNYSDFTATDSGDMPESINITVEGLDKPLSLGLKLSNIKQNGYVYKESNVSTYTKLNIRNIQDILK